VNDPQDLGDRGRVDLHRARVALLCGEPRELGE
jgi:hypothetical protein